jgi:hypothetical protein
MTEASWGSDFRPATAISTYWWAFLTAWLVYDRALELLWWNLYSGERAWRSPKWILRRAVQIALYGFAGAVGIVLVVAALAVLLVLVILAQVPGARRWVGALVTLFADFLGDPQVWKRKPLQAAAMRQRVSDTLHRWNHAGVDVTVVAHSQGAAISGQLLFQNKGRARATNFISVGSGLSLLGYADWGGRSEDPVQDWVEKAAPTRWINVWGKFDFVPAGPIGTKTSGDDAVFKEIFDPTNGPGAEEPSAPGSPIVFNPEEHPVYNRSAMIKDHIVYSKNRIEVIDPLAALLLRPKAAPVTQFGPEADERRLKPHRVMVKSLGVTRLLAAIFGGLTSPIILAWLSLPWAKGLLMCGDSPTKDPWWSTRLCSGAVYQWVFMPSWDWLVLSLTAVLPAAVMLTILNTVIWEVLHSLVERRRKKPRRRIDENWARLIGRDDTENVDQSVGKPAGSPWVWVVLYLLFVAGVAVVVPLALIRPSPFWVIVYICSAALWGLCFRDTGISYLAPSPSDEDKRRPGAEEPVHAPGWAG